jgi:Transposase DDE domain
MVDLQGGVMDVEALFQ